MQLEFLRRASAIKLNAERLGFQPTLFTNGDGVGCAFSDDPYNLTCTL